MADWYITWMEGHPRGTPAMQSDAQDLDAQHGQTGRTFEMLGISMLDPCLLKRHLHFVKVWPNRPKVGSGGEHPQILGTINNVKKHQPKSRLDRIHFG